MVVLVLHDATRVAAGTTAEAAIVSQEVVLATLGLLLVVLVAAALLRRRRYGSTPLFEACGKHTPLPELERLLRERPRDVNAKNTQRRYSALHYAAGLGDPRVVTLLLDSGADVNASTIDGVTPLQYATHSNELQAVRLLLSRGAEVNACGKQSPILIYRLTPLGIAMKRGYSRVAAALKDAGGTS